MTYYKRNAVTVPSETLKGDANQHELGFVDEVKNVLNMGRVKKAFRLGVDVFNAAQPYIERPNLWNAGRMILGVGRVFVEDVEMWSETFFDGDEWIRPFNRDFNPTILEVLVKFPFQSFKTAEENTYIRLIDVNGCKCGWAFNTKLNTIHDIYVEADKAHLARDMIQNLLWEKFKDQPLVMRMNRRAVPGSNEEAKVVFEVDDAFHPLPSEKASEYSSYLKKCIDAGVHRSVMLYGPPGTGKSTMSRTIIENLNLRSFRIRVEDVGGLDSSMLFESINIFKPDAVIFDDFDRTHGQAALLETLEFFQRHVKLVIATVNDRNNLDEALLRPGRFDELVLVDQMDEGVIKHMLGEYVDGYELVKKWPIAFIQEYVKRRRFMTDAEAARSMIELAERVSRLQKYSDNNYVDKQMWNNISSSEQDEDDDQQEDEEVASESRSPVDFDGEPLVASTKPRPRASIAKKELDALLSDFQPRIKHYVDVGNKRLDENNWWKKFNRALKRRYNQR